MRILEVAGLSKSFGALKVISDLDLAIEAGARHAVIGPNGAGKTTLFNIMTGWLRPDAGEVRVAGENVTGLTPQEISFRGVARSFQRNTLFEGLSVFENLRLAAQGHDRSRFRALRHRRAFAGIVAAAEEVARRVGLADVLAVPVAALSYGQKRQLELGMALAQRPQILLLDEPAAGTSPAERQRLIRLIADLPRGMTLVLVEHDMDVVFEVCATITVVSNGRHLATGTPAEMRDNPLVRDAYLGKSHARR
jgi:branched-chain amino acid transport system ATP-binding protein